MQVPDLNAPHETCLSKALITLTSRLQCHQQALQYLLGIDGAKSQCYSASHGSGSRGSTPGARLATSTRCDPQLHRSTVPSPLGIHHLANLFGCEYPIRLDKTVHSILHSQVSWMGGLYVQSYTGRPNSQQLTLHRHLRRRMGILGWVLHIYILYSRVRWRGSSVGCTIRSCH